MKKPLTYQLCFHTTDEQASLVNLFAETHNINRSRAIRMLLAVGLQAMAEKERRQAGQPLPRLTH
jgi:hypothetical protein